MADRTRSRGVCAGGRLRGLPGKLGLLVLCLGTIAASSLPLAAGPGPYDGGPLAAAAPRLSVSAGDPFRTAWISPELDQTFEVAWGDYDGDGDLDLAVGNDGQNRLYRNNGVLEGFPQWTVVWSSPEVDATTGIAWGDYDADGDLDLAVGNTDGQPNRLYRSDGVVQGRPVLALAWSSAEHDYTTGIAWGDVDGDGDLDLAVGNSGQPNRIYYNQDGMLSSTADWSSDESDATQAVTWGDYDGDGDLDLAVANGSSQANRLYRNEGGVLNPSAVWSSAEAEYSYCIAWGDADGDGDLDLAVGNIEANRIYRNDGVAGGLPHMVPAWSSAEADQTHSLAWGDYDGDGDLDLAAGNYYEPIRVYRNDGPLGGTFQFEVAWSALQAGDTLSVAWGDYDGDGDLDLAVGSGGSNPPKANRLYRNDGVM
ncbi:MAG: VCBS repeat-containing protein, partial [Chloroflexia bacterium]|nr:VCBS repeat-containing protein [Chloroflexia bacterium]